MISTSELRSLIKGFVLIGFFLGLVLKPVSPAYAATLTVNSLADTNDGVCSATNCTLREAINAANGTPASDNIRFSLDGTITLGSALPSITSAGGLVTIDGTGRNVRVSGANAYRPFYINSSADLTLINLNIRNGYTTGSGGGIYNLGTLILQDCELVSNRAHDDGGGIYNEGTLTIENILFSNNTTDLGDGGGLYIYGGNVDITGGTFQSNRANLSGGGIYNHDQGYPNIGGDLDIQGTTFLLNNAYSTYGGAIYNGYELDIDRAVFWLNTAQNQGGGLYQQAGGNFSIDNSTFSYNSSTLESGGGIYVSDTYLYSSCHNCTFNHNSAGLDGGGFYVARGSVSFLRTRIANNEAGQDGGGGYNLIGAVSIEHDSFESNTADRHGGGLFNGHEMNIDNSTFSGNSALDNGGGVYQNAGAYYMNIVNDTFYNNSADRGGGLYLLAQAYLINCTISANSASVAGGGGGLYASYLTHVINTIIANSPTGGNCDWMDSLPNNVGNNIDSGSSCTWGFADGSMSFTDPLLGALKDNGGTTKTMLLLPFSPAIDGVTYNSPNLCPEDDQREFSRPYGARCDIGAVEQYYRIYLPITIRN